MSVVDEPIATNEGLSGSSIHQSAPPSLVGCTGLASIFAGVVENTIYLGQATRYHVKVADAVSLVAESHNPRRMPKAAPDGGVMVGWAAEDMVVL